MSILGEDKLLRFDDLGLLMDKVTYGYIKSNSTQEVMTDVVTPYNVAKAMVESLCTWTNGEIFTDPNAKFLDIYCKSGIYLGLIYNDLMIGLVDAIPDTIKRSEHIINNMLYGACPCEVSALISRKTAYGDMLTTGNIRVINNYIGLSTTDRALRLKEEFNGMKFDVVIGNPPYNRGMDIDFVNLGYELSSKFTCMITPAKWQTAEADQKIASKMSYGEFREKLVPHMSHVVFYPDCKDVFDSAIQTDGISYFLIDKDSQVDKALVTNVCSLLPILNKTEYVDLTSKCSLMIIGNTIVRYLGNYIKYDIEQTVNGRYQVYISDMLPGSGFYRLSKTNMGIVVISSYSIYDSNTGISYGSSGVQSGKDSSVAKLVYASDELSECESFISWLYSRFTRFFIIINISTRGIFNNNCFRFVPAPTVLDANGNRVPGKFDHIYTDEELYKTFNLPQEYIDVIEAVIKERK